MTPTNASESLTALQQQLAQCRQQLDNDQVNHDQLTERLKKSMNFLTTRKTGASIRQFHQRQIPSLKKSIQQLEQHQTGLILRIKRLQQQIIDATPDNFLHGQNQRIIAFFRGRLASYPWLGPSLAITLVMILFAILNTNPNANADPTKTADNPKTEQPSDPTNPTPTTTTHTNAESQINIAPPPKPVALLRTNTGSPVRQSVQTLCDELEKLNNTDRLQTLRSRINDLPPNLRGQEIAALLADAPNYRRADLLDIIIKNAGQHSIDPANAPQILGDATASTRTRMLRQLIGHMPDTLSVGQSMLILDNATSSSRLALITELAPAIERPINIGGLEQLAQSFDRLQREQMIDILKKSSPNYKNRSRSIGEMLGR